MFQTSVNSYKPHILIADDSRGIVQLLRSFCEHEGYRTSEAYDGFQAIQMTQTLQPDLVMLDMNMPKASGLDVTKAIRSDTHLFDIPIIMLTGLTGREERLKAVSAGVSDFQNKPVDREELMLRVRNMLRMKKMSDLLQEHNRELEDLVQQRTRELEKVLAEVTEANRSIHEGYAETINRLAVVSEYRDEDTGMHIKRVSLNSREIASALGMDSGYVENLGYAAVTHDIGKVAIPDQILLKNGSFTDLERSLMMKHTVIGAQMLSGSNSPYLNMAEKVALTHHERWDGSGYPNQLFGETIPLEGRIVSLADQYDALRTQRTYKPAFSHKKTYDILTLGDQRTSPEHFCPEVLSAFKRIHLRLEEIYQNFQDSLTLQNSLADTLSN